MALPVDLLTGAPALSAIASVRLACRDTDGTDPLDEAADLRIKHHGVEGTAAWVSSHGFALRHDRALDLAVSPAARGEGLGTALATAALREPGPVSAWSHGDHPGAARIAARHSMSRIRSLWVMRRPTDVPLPLAPIPAGIEIRGFQGDAHGADADALLAVNAAAFANHPEQGGLDRDGLAERMAEAWFDPAGLLMAYDGGRLVGFHWTKRHGAVDGEVYVVAVDPSAQGRGLGRVLTAAGLDHLATGAVEEVHLYVESDNDAARAVYSGLGFTHSPADTHVQYARP